MKFETYYFPIPFRRAFRHSSASRSRAENFIIKATLKPQFTGWGESCPRDYVTGESRESCEQFLRNHHSSLADIKDLRSLRAWIENHTPVIDQNPSAFCALEIAILDALGKEHSVPIETLLGIEQRKDTVEYSAVLGDSSYGIYWLLAQRYRIRGFRDFKVKLSGELNKDQRKLQLWSNHRAQKWRVRIDANNLWTNVEDSLNYLQRLPSCFWAIEEPLGPKDYSALATLAQSLKKRFILDESATRVSDLEHYIGDQWIVNLRISKCGGILRAIELARTAKSRGFDVIVGAHVGESSILTRATLVLTQYLRSSQLATEGAFGTHLLAQDLVDHPLQFARNGRLQLSQLDCLNQPGLGLNVQAELLKLGRSVE